MKFLKKEKYFKEVSEKYGVESAACLNSYIASKIEV